MDGSHRSWFLSLMGAVYFCAFLSYYIQYPGLLGEDGLLPARQFWEDIRRARLDQVQMQPAVKLDLNIFLGWWTQGVLAGRVNLPSFEVIPSGKAKSLRAFLNFPTWLWFLCDGRNSLQVDQALEGIALLGVVLSALAVLGVHNVVVFALLYTNYLSLYLLGQRWLGFQWDIFLLETGAMLLLFCPFASLRARGAVPPAAWLLRALIVKFMYLNGLVKVMANCPTWKHLTALEYHFASTCIPTAEAWTLHQLPPFLLRLGVAGMFVVELAAPWLLLVPIRAVRQVGVLVQAALQLGIFLTGNYNWFNAHTLILLLPAWEDDRYGESGGSLPLSLLTWLPRTWGSFWSSRLGRLLSVLGTCGALAAASVVMFEVRAVGAASAVSTADLLRLLPAAAADPRGTMAALAEDRWQVKALFGVTESSRFTSKTLSPRCVGVFFVFVCLSCLRYAVSPLSRQRDARAPLVSGAEAACRSLGRAAAVMLVPPMLGLCLLPLEHSVQGFAGAVPFSIALRPLEQALSPWQVSTSYGLFRRMTGVGRAARGSKGWGGLPPSIVEVPAVVLEGSSDGADWSEIPFRYTPGKPSRQPRRTAPHQPRLDWQMWFAALGSYEHNPWLVHLLYKLLEGSAHTLALLDVEESPWPELATRPKFLRAWLYHYDFTRLDTPWARRIPSAAILNFSQPKAAGLWWTRTKVKEYVPAVSLESLKEVVQRQGWPVGKKRREAALRRVANCTAAWRRGSLFGQGCNLVISARTWAEPLRWKTGWSLRSSLLRKIWPGASELWFLDVHFLLLVGPLLLMGLVRCLAGQVVRAGLAAVGFLDAKGRASGPTSKVKEE